MGSKEVNNVAIVYHYFAHYREPILRSLCSQTKPDPQYTLISGQNTNLPALKLIDVKKASEPIEKKGLRWRLVRNHWIIGPLLWQSGLIKFAVSREFDAIIYLGNPFFLSTWVSCLLSVLTGKRVLMWTHGYRLKEKTGLRGFIKTLFYKLSHGLLLYGDIAREVAMSRGFSSERLYVIYNSLDSELQRDLREKIDKEDLRCVKSKLFGNKEWPIVICTSRLTRIRRLDLLLHATKMLKSRGVDINVLLVGDGPEKDALSLQAKEHGIDDRVVFYGACYNEEDLARMISASHVSVAPGKVGLTCIHSLTYGTPVITHDNPDDQMPEWEAIVPGKTGALFRYNDIEDLADKVKEWTVDAPSRKAVREACYSVVDSFYNLKFQKMIINEAVKGTPAHNLPRFNGPIVEMFKKSP